MQKEKTRGGLGFKSMRHLNAAMLGKLAWKMINQPNTLWVKILREVYCPDISEFWSISPKVKDSGQWKSILNSRRLAIGNGIWSVSNGENIKVFDQKWLLGGKTIPSTTQHEGLQHIKVDLLIDRDNTIWNTNAIKSTVGTQWLDEILKVKIHHERPHDKIWWPMSADGRYTVRTAYRWLQAQEGESSVQQNSKFPFTRLHKLKFISPKLKIFIWRLINRALPVLEELRRRKVIREEMALCNYCKEEPESLRHLFIDCTLAKETWSHGPGRQEVRWSSAEISQQLARVIKDESDDTILYIVAGLWILWTERCKFYFRGERPKVYRIKIEIDKLVNLQKEADSRTKLVRPRLNGWGVVLQSKEGKFVQAWAGISHPESPLQAEYHAIQQALMIIQIENLQDVSIHSDCMMAVEGIKSPVKNIEDDQVSRSILFIREKAQNLNITIHYVSREYNLPAHDLAKYVVVNKCNLTSHQGVIPDCIIHHY